jgi:hypothetical protein
MCCLTHVHYELGRLGRDPSSLAPYQQSILGELEGGFDEEAISQLFWGWRYDIPRLATQLDGGAKPQPRIELSVDITRRDNLAATWMPGGIVDGRPGPNSDWKHWYRIEGGFSRPSNELLFVRDVGHALQTFDSNTKPFSMKDFPSSLIRPETESYLRRERRAYQQKNLTIDATLLQGVAGLVKELQDRLKLSFTVRMVSDIFMEFQSKGDHTKAGTAIDRLVDWRIENVEERNRRLGLLEIGAFKKTMGFPLDVFVKEALAARRRKDGTPVQDADRRDGRATKALKDAGHKITLGQVSHFRSLLEQYRADLLPRMPDPKVTPFRRPDGRDNGTRH